MEGCLTAIKSGKLVKSYARGIVKGYTRIVKSAGAVLAVLFIVALISAAIATPLWFIATRATALYTTLSLCGLCAAIVTPVVIRFIKDPSKRSLYARRFVRFLTLVLLTVSLYFVFLLYAWGLWAAAVPATIVFIAASGLVLYGKCFSKS